MTRLVLTTLLVGVSVSIGAVIISIAFRDWRWMYGTAVVGVMFLFAAIMSLWSPAGFGGMGGRTTRRQFKEIYRDNPTVLSAERRASNKSSLVCACIAVPNLIIPIVVAIIRHAL